MLRHFRGGATVLAAVLIAALLAGCTDSTIMNIPSQSIATVEKLKNKVLSKDEQDSAIRDLSLAQETHRKEALSEIEKR